MRLQRLRLGLPERVRMGRNRRPAWTAFASIAEQKILRERARAAQRNKDWRTAARLWRQCWEKTPGDRDAVIGYFGILLFSGEIDKAESLAGAFAADNPEDETGPMLLARAAEARGDFQAAIGHLRAALAIQPRKQQALVRLGTALLEESRFDEAVACAVELQSLCPGDPHGQILRAQIAQREHGFDCAAPLWTTLIADFPKSAHALRSYGRALLAAGKFDECLAVANDLRAHDRYEALNLTGQTLAARKRYEDHTGFWTAACLEVPDHPDLIRKRLNAALWARRLKDAEEALQNLLTIVEPRASDADFVIGLTNLHLGSGNRTSARQLIRAYLKQLRHKSDYRAAALRLIRQILASFPGSAGAAARISRDRRYFMRMLKAARIEESATSVLAEIAELEHALQRSGATCLFDTDVDRCDCEALIGIIRGRLSAQEPFSLIRLGDAESSALHYDSPFASHFECDRETRERIWWGRTLEPRARTDLAIRVRTAIEDADCLGIPTKARFLRDVPFHSVRGLSATPSGRGLLAVMHTLRESGLAAARGGGVLTSAHIQQDLQRWNLYPALFAGVNEVVTVSCHPGLSDVISRRFGTRVVKAVVIPPGDAALEMQGRHLDDLELPPHSIDRALHALGDWPRGRMVLIGAGYAGKILIHEAKQRGGVAIDLGSIFDHWIGANTRSYQDIA